MDVVIRSKFYPESPSLPTPWRYRALHDALERDLGSDVCEQPWDAAAGCSQGMQPRDAPGRIWPSAGLGAERCRGLGGACRELHGSPKAESKLPVEKQQVFPFLSEYSGVCGGFLPPACQYLPVAIDRVQRINGQKNPKPTTKPTPWWFFVLFVFSIFQIVLQGIQNFTLRKKRLV